MFYQDEFTRLSQNNGAFSFMQYLSQDESDTTEKGYVTDKLIQDYVAPFQEFYICGSPVMVRSVRDMLAGFGIPKESIKFEQY